MTESNINAGLGKGTQFKSLGVPIIFNKILTLKTVKEYFTDV